MDSMKPADPRPNELDSIDSYIEANPIAVPTERGAELLSQLELTGEHQNFELNPDEFGWRYFDEEEEASKEYLRQFKQIGRWFSQMAVRERPKVIKQWREMMSWHDVEWLDEVFIQKLYEDKNDMMPTPIQAKEL